MVAPLMVDDESEPAPRDALLIGLAAGTVARQLTAAYGQIPIEGVEIDPRSIASPESILPWVSWRTST
jgi:spermidine synthase